MGKQARSIILSWLNKDKGLTISKKGMLNNLCPEDVCDEIKNLLSDLQSDLTLGVFSETISESERTEQQEAYEQLSFFH